MATKGFSQISNELAFDLDLSTTAFLLYFRIQYHAGKKDFQLNRAHIKSESGLGETAFRRAWKELKDKGVLVQIRKRVNGKFVYEYDLKYKVEKQKKEDTPVKKEEIKETAPAKVDSDGNVPMEGQIHVSDVVTKEDNTVTTEENKNVEIIENATELNKSQSKELLNIANNNISKVIESYQYVVSQENVKNVFKYTKWVLKNKKAKNINPVENKFNNINTGHFNNFEQRSYNFKALEAALLGQEYKNLYN